MNNHTTIFTLIQNSLSETELHANLVEFNYMWKQHANVRFLHYSSLVRTAIDFLRKHKRVELIGDNALLQLSEQDTYRNLDLQQALHHLPLQLREVVVLRYFE